MLITRIVIFQCAGFLLGFLLSNHLSAAQEASCTSAVPAASTGESVRMVFAGDIVLGNSFLVDNIPVSWDGRYFAGVRAMLKGADVVFGNLEGVLTEHADTRKDPATGRQFAFRMPPRYAHLLRQEGFNILNVANNHASDFGDAGFLDTLSLLKEENIAVTGPRDQAGVISARGLKIAVLGFTYSSRFNSIFELERDVEMVRQAKAQGAYVIVTFHAGAEGASAIWHGNEDEMFLGENRGNTVAFARAMIDAGADLAVGHGPHVLREAECYQGHPIIYSLGNAVGVGGLSAKKFAAVSALLEVTVSADGALQHLDMIPIRFNEQKLPQPDPQAFGKRLVNYLGQHAQYTGTFIEFPVGDDGQEEFQAWFNANNPPAPVKVSLRH